MPEPGDEKGNPGVSADAGHVEAARVLQVFGEPEDVEVPDGVEEDLGDGEDHDEAHADELLEADGRGCGNFAGLQRGDAVEPDPERQPEEAGEADGEEGLAPSVMLEQPGDQGRGEDGSYGSAGIEDARGQGAFAFGEPFGHHFDAGRPVACFAHAEQKAACAQAERIAGEGVEHGGGGPPTGAQGIAQACSEAIDQRAGDAVHDGVGEQKAEDDARVFDVAHVELGADGGGCDGERLAIEVIDGGRPEGEGDHEPAEGAGLH